jgi:hypothetical protein
LFADLLPSPFFLSFLLPKVLIQPMKVSGGSLRQPTESDVVCFGRLRRRRHKLVDPREVLRDADRAAEDVGRGLDDVDELQRLVVIDMMMKLGFAPLRLAQTFPISRAS